jgi:hypothetical protein
MAACLAVPVRSAAGASVVPAGAVITVGTSPVTLAVPADGRLDSFDTAAQIQGAATGSRLGPYRAVPGQQLWAFGVHLTVERAISTFPSPTVTLIADGVRTSLPVTPSADTTGNAEGQDLGVTYLVASLPAAAPDVVVELSSAGYAQDFSLTHMARQGPQPAALYRQSDGFPLDQPLADQ